RGHRPPPGLAHPHDPGGHRPRPRPPGAGLGAGRGPLGGPGRPPHPPPHRAPLMSLSHTLYAHLTHDGSAPYQNGRGAFEQVEHVGDVNARTLARLLALLVERRVLSLEDALDVASLSPEDLC